MDLKTLGDTIEQLGAAQEAWRERRDKEFEDLQNEVKGLAVKAGRPNFGFAPGEHQMTPADRKALENGARALIAGDKAKADAYFIEAKAMNAGTGPDGGFLVHTQLSAGFTKVMQEFSPIYRLSRVIQINQGYDTFEEPIDRDTAAALWTGEQTTRGESGTPQLGMFAVALNEIYAMPKVTQTLIDTANIDILSWLQTKVGEAFAVKESLAFHTGSGVAQPMGFMSGTIVSTGDATRAWGQLQYVPGGHASQLNDSDPLIDVITAMKPQYRNGAVWLMNRNSAAVIQKMKDTTGRYIWTDSLIAGQPSTLLGYPVEMDEQMPDIGANAYPVAFGNFQRAYTVIEKPGIKFLPDPYTAKPHVLLYSYRRVGGAMNNSEAIKMLKISVS